MADYVFPQNILVPLTTFSSTQTTDTGVLRMSQQPKQALVGLFCTQAASSAGATLDVYVQHKITSDPSSSGPQWDDVIHFNQITTTAGNQFAKWSAIVNPTSSGTTLPNLGVYTPISGSLAAGLVRQGPIGPDWRVRVVVTTTSSATPFKCAVVAQSYS